MPKGVYVRRPLTEEHKLNMSLAKKGKTPKNIGRIAGWNRGLPMNESMRQKVREDNLRNPRKFWQDKKGENAPVWRGGRKEAAKRWRKNNAERVCFYSNRRRALKASLKGSFTEQEWIALKITHGNICLCCRKSEPNIKLTIDHVVPITKGGTNFIENIQPLCKSCNSSKRDKTIDYRQHA